MEPTVAEGGNTVVPAVLALEARGFTVREVHGRLRAESERGTFVADDPVALLGLVALVEIRGPRWRAEDAEIDDVLRRHDWTT